MAESVLTPEMFEAFTKKVLAEALEPSRSCPHLVSSQHARQGGWGHCSWCFRRVLIVDGRVTEVY